MSPKIKVDRAALEELSKKISAEVHHAGQVGNQAAARADVTTGAGPLDAALDGWNQWWRGRVNRDEHVGEQVAGGVSAAADVYGRADAAAIPRGVAGGGDTVVSKDWSGGGDPG